MLSFLCSFLFSYFLFSTNVFGCNLNINLWCCYITSVLSLSTYCCCFHFHFSFFPLSVFLYFYKPSSSVSSLPELSIEMFECKTNKSDNGKAERWQKIPPRALIRNVDGCKSNILFIEASKFFPSRSRLKSVKNF
jgi:hypothetical protein